MNSQQLNSQMVSHGLTGQHYGFSAVDLNSLGSARYTLVTLVIDESPSVESYKKAMEECIKEAVEGCKKNYADYLLLRVVAFSEALREIHGFKLLQDCKPSDYDNCLRIGNRTLLFESSLNAITASLDYGVQMAKQDFDVNAIVVVMTDGMDNMSSRTNGPKSIKKVVSDIQKQEELESIINILVGVGVGGYDGVKDYLDNFKNEAGFDQYISIEEANRDSLSKLSGFISKSVSSQSQALGSGKASQPLQF